MNITEATSMTSTIAWQKNEIMLCLFVTLDS